MTSATAKLLAAARALPAGEKLELVDKLLAEIDIPDPAIEAEWAEEALKRSEAIRAGKMSTKPLDEVLRKYSA